MPPRSASPSRLSEAAGDKGKARALSPPRLEFDAAIAQTWDAWARNYLAQPEDVPVDPDDLDMFSNTVQDWMRAGNPEATLELFDGAVAQLAPLPNGVRHLDASENRLCVFPDLPRDARTVMLAHNRLTHVPDEVFDHPTLQQLDVSGNPLSPQERSRIESKMAAEGYKGPIVVLGSNKDLRPSALGSFAPVRTLLEGRGFTAEHSETIALTLLALGNHPDPAQRSQMHAFEAPKKEWLQEGKQEWIEIEDLKNDAIARTSSGHAIVNVTKFNEQGPSKITTVLQPGDPEKLQAMKVRRDKLQGKTDWTLKMRATASVEETRFHQPGADPAEVNAAAAAAAERLEVRTAQDIYPAVQAILERKQRPAGSTASLAEASADEPEDPGSYPYLKRGLAPSKGETALAYLLRLTRCVDISQLNDRFEALGELMYDDLAS